MVSAKPNILFIQADQLAAAFLPCYGHPVVRTPHLDRLAERAVVFDNAYCASPLCAPSRYSMLTGQLCSRIGAFDNAADFPADVPTFAHGLRAAGYRTVLSGKMHFCGPDQLHGFEERLTTDIYPADYGWTPDWTGAGQRPSWYHDMLSVTQAGPVARSNQIDFDEEVAFHARRKLYDLARYGDGRPFAMVVSFTHPHDPYAIRHEYWERYRAEDIDPPATPALPLEQQDPHSRRLLAVYGADADPPPQEAVLRARRAYYGAISFVDEQVGALLGTLAECGASDSTLVVFTADHGDMLGERGLWYKMCFFEHAARVPLLVSFPGTFPARRESRTVSLLDLVPTLDAVAGDGLVAAAGVELDGRSLATHLEGRGGHDEALGEYLGEGAVAPLVMIRRGRHKFLHGPGDPDQLYDLVADPAERHDLAGEGSPALLEAFRAETARRWDLEALRASVLASQRRRRLVDRAMRSGRRTGWDHQPVMDAGEVYMRGHRDLPALERRSRLPPFA